MVIKIAEKLIDDNDVYVFAKTKDFFVINFNYQGLLVFDRCFQAKRCLRVGSEFFVYSLFSSLDDNRLVISDAENDKMYIIDLGKKDDPIIQMDNEKIFLHYYIAGRDEFTLADSMYTYSFSYRNGDMVSRTQYNREGTFLRYHDEELYSCKQKMFYRRNSKLIELPFAFECGHLYDVQKGIVSRYDEKRIELYRKAVIIGSVSIENGWALRQVCVDDDRAYLLVNNKWDITQNRIDTYSLK